MSHNATASRVLDALLESPTVPTQAKRQFILSLLDSFHLLIDDRIGSRIADRCWAFADTYFRVNFLLRGHPFLIQHYRKRLQRLLFLMSSSLQPRIMGNFSLEISIYTCCNVDRKNGWTGNHGKRHQPRKRSKMAR